MKYEYTGNCTLEEKIDLVSKEIVNEYPDITLEKAKSIAMIDSKITKKIDNHFKFRRLYNILLFCFNDKIIFSKVLKDLINIYNDISDKTKLEINIFEDIILFYKGSIEKFPIISEYL